MIEIRLCSLVLARWLDANRSGGSPPLSSDDLGPMFARLVDTTPVSSLSPVAKVGVKFESAGLVVSVAHALGLAAAIAEVDSKEADRIEQFVLTRASDLPASLSQVGAFSVMPKHQALTTGAWIRAVDKEIFEQEVASMFGPSAVSAYVAIARDLQRFFLSVAVHGADVCVLQA